MNQLGLVQDTIRMGLFLQIQTTMAIGEWMTIPVASGRIIGESLGRVQTMQVIGTTNCGGDGSRLSITAMTRVMV